MGPTHLIKQRVHPCIPRVSNIPPTIAPTCCTYCYHQGRVPMTWMWIGWQGASAKQVGWWLSVVVCCQVTWWEWPGILIQAILRSLLYSTVEHRFGSSCYELHRICLGFVWCKCNCCEDGPLVRRATCINHKTVQYSGYGCQCVLRCVIPRMPVEHVW